MNVFCHPGELRRRALEVLVRELGYADAMRFMLQYEAGTGDYTRDRDHILPKWSLDEWIRESERMRERAEGDNGAA